MDENFLSGPYPIKEESISEIVNCGWSCGHSVLKGQLKKISKLLRTFGTYLRYVRSTSARTTAAIEMHISTNSMRL